MNHNNTLSSLAVIALLSLLASCTEPLPDEFNAGKVNDTSIESKSKNMSQATIERNLASQAFGKELALAKGDVAKQIRLYEDYIARYPEKRLPHASLGILLAENGRLSEAKPHLALVLNPGPKTVTTVIYDSMLVYWYLKAGRMDNDQVTIDRAIELKKLKTIRDVLGNTLHYDDLTSAGLSVDAIAKLGAGLAYVSSGLNTVLGHQLLDELGAEYPDNWVVCSILAHAAYGKADRWNYLKTTYKLAPPEYKQRLIADDSDLGWSIMNIRQELGEIPE